MGAFGNYILGLDLGPNSVGWALLACEGEGNALHPTGFLDTSKAKHLPIGVRVFEAGVPQMGTQKEKAPAQDRRMARSARRMHARRAARKRRLREVLSAAGLLPDTEAELAEVMLWDPYWLRARALDERLEPYELGRALYHLCQRRGFKSNRKSGRAKEDRGILAEMGALQQDIDESGARTVGEYLHCLAGGEPVPGRRNCMRRPALERGERRLRKRHTRRSMYEKELELILEAQKAHHPDALDVATIATIRHCILFQHPFEVTEERRRRAPSRANLHRSPSVRPCPLEKGERCCPRSDWLAQRFRLLKELNNLRIEEGYSGFRELRVDEREALLALLEAADKVTFDRMRKELAKLGRQEDVKFNLEEGGRKSLQGNWVDHALRVCLGRRRWAVLDDAARMELRRVLVEEEDEDRLVQILVQHGADAEKARRAAAAPIPEGYVGYSRKALARLLPYLEEGMNEWEAIQTAYPERDERETQPLLPSLVDERTPVELRELTNPVVRRTLVEVRKVVNAIIREHGKPRRIVVELAREMKDGPQRRKGYARRIRARQDLRASAEDEIRRATGIVQVSREDVERYLLWREQKETCPYTGRPISISQLFSGAVDVDHIWPRWQSLDDSMMNKVVCFREANLEKGNRTPAQWLGPDSEAFRHLRLRVEDMCRHGGMPWAKLRRMEATEVDASDFTERQLRDTAYATRKVVEYLHLLYPPEWRQGQKAVQTTRGGLTAELRRQWGLNGLLASDGGKTREDHRHHAVDAVVVAATSRAMLKRYQDFWKEKEALEHHLVKHGRPVRLDPPWTTIRSELEELLGKVVVSHRTMGKIKGAFHQETFYGRIDEGTFVYSVPVEKLTSKMIEEIVSPSVQRCVLAHLREQYGWVPASGEPLPRNWWEGLSIRARDGHARPIRKVRVRKRFTGTVALGDRKHRHAPTANNHHVEVVARDGAGGDLEFHFVTTLEAARRAHTPGVSIIRRDHGPGRRVVMSLARKESVLVRLEDGDEVRETVCVVQMLSPRPGNPLQPYIVFRKHNDARVATEGNRDPALRTTSSKKFQAHVLRKVRVDPLGRIHPCAD